jgi:hypothetical protein
MCLEFSKKEKGGVSINSLEPLTKIDEPTVHNHKLLLICKDQNCVS